MSGRVARNENIFIATERLDKIDTQIYFNRAGIIEQGFYYKQLQRYLKFFPRNQILVLLYDELKENPVYYIQKIFSFLKVDESFIRSVIDKRINVDIYSESLRLINRTGRKLGKICPKFQYYLELLVLRLRKKYVKKKQPGMDINIRMKLIDIYRDDIVELAKFLEKGLSVWLKAEKKGIKQ